MKNIRYDGILKFPCVAYVEEINKIVEVKQIKWNYNTNKIDHISYDSIGEMVPHISEHFRFLLPTALMDKYGNEMIEGNIIRSVNQHGTYLHTGIVKRSKGLKWNYNGFDLLIIDSPNKDSINKLSNFSPNSIWWHGDESANNDEIIGHCLVNPELLPKGFDIESVFS